MKKTVAFSKNSSNIFFHILTDCNLSCRHCYINKEQHGRNTLKLTTIEKWLDVFKKRCRDPNVIFLGGEPTLHPDLPGAIKKAKQLDYKSITVDTNGYLFNGILDKTGPDEVDYFSFSLDGATRRTNDMIRGNGSFERCISGLRKTGTMGFSTSLIYTVSSLNIHEINQLVPLIADLEIDRLFIQVIGLRGRSAMDGSGKLQVSKDEWQEKIPEAARKAAGFGITVTYPKVFLEPGEPFECAGLTADNYFVFPNGRIYACPLCEDFPLHGMVFDNDVLVKTGRINEVDLFPLDIPEGCVMNRLIQPENLSYDHSGTPEYKIACCMLKEEVAGAGD